MSDITTLNLRAPKVSQHWRLFCTKCLIIWSVWKWNWFMYKHKCALCSFTQIFCHRKKKKVKKGSDKFPEFQNFPWWRQPFYSTTEPTTTFNSFIYFSNTELINTKMLLEQSENFTTTYLNFTTPTPGGGKVGGCPPVGIQLEGVIMPPVLIIDIILGLLGNIVALWIFCFKLKAWNPNNLFLFNLVIADFLVLLSLPLRIDALLRGHWVFGDGLCRLNLFLMFSNRSASIGLMTVVAIYRYFKVRNRFYYGTLSTSTLWWKCSEHVEHVCYVSLGHPQYSVIP